MSIFFYFLSGKGHQVVPLRRELFEQKHFPQLLNIISTSDAVINLAGAPINRRWTPSYKRILLESRLHTTSNLVDAINTAGKPPRLFISASANDYYPRPDVMMNMTLRRRTVSSQNYVANGKRKPVKSFRKSASSLPVSALSCHRMEALLNN